MYRIFNNNLLYHGCVPLDESGNFEGVVFGKKRYRGRDYLDYAEHIARRAWSKDAKDKDKDFMWYLWCGRKSPLSGRNIKTFERTYVKDEATWHEESNPYYRFYEEEKVCNMILHEFGLYSERSHIINGHTPVRTSKGEHPVRLSALPSLDFHPDIIHCHDWQTGLVPVYLKDMFSENPFYLSIKTIMTIHNLKFQGVWDLQKVKDITGLKSYFFTSDKLEAYGDANYLKGGIVYADMVTTVSESYAEEIKMPFYGEHLDGLMRARSNCLTGIVNGLDYNEYNPETDPLIYKNYTAKTFRKEKIKNKRGLQKELGLAEDDKKFMIGICSRLTDQKGLDLVDCVIEQICDENTQLVVLGTGEERYENLFRHFEWKYHDRVSANIFYSNDRSHKLYAACDAFLMPSLFEPCGLSQMMSLKYGTIPIVRETGGLADSVQPYNEFEQTGTGFSFSNYNAHEMMDTIDYALHTFYDYPDAWDAIVQRAMAEKLDWDASAEQYIRLFASLL